MRNEIAEWVLSQVAPPEQAATIVGDLLEAHPGPGAFWFAVVRATASIARHQSARRVLIGFLWFTYDLGLNTWVFVCAGLFWHRTKHFLLLLGFTTVWFVIGSALDRGHKREPSLLAFPLGFFWFSVHVIGAPTALAVASAMFMLVLDVRLRWRQWQKNAAQQNDRPVAE